MSVIVPWDRAYRRAKIVPGQMIATLSWSNDDEIPLPRVSVVAARAFLAARADELSQS